MQSLCETASVETEIFLQWIRLHSMKRLKQNYLFIQTVGSDYAGRNLYLLVCGLQKSDEMVCGRKAALIT